MVYSPWMRGLAPTMVAMALTSAVGAGEEGGARVDDGAGGGGHGFAVHGERVHVDLPVALTGERDVVEGTGVVLGVDLADEELARLVVAEVEGEELLGRRELG